MGQKERWESKALEARLPILGRPFPRCEERNRDRADIFDRTIERSNGWKRAQTFATTHSITAEFSDISLLSHPLATRLASAILSNSQVHWIHDDEDVKKFITEFIVQYGARHRRRDEERSREAYLMRTTQQQRAFPSRRIRVFTTPTRTLGF